MADEHFHEETSDLWADTDHELRGPVEVICVAGDKVELEEIIEWGEVTGFWNIRVVQSAEEAIAAQHKEPRFFPHAFQH